MLGLTLPRTFPSGDLKTFPDQLSPIASTHYAITPTALELPYAAYLARQITISSLLYHEFLKALTESYIQ